MDWGSVGAALALLLGGGVIGALVTWRVHAAQLAFEREKHTRAIREERRARLGGLYKQTLSVMATAHVRINTERREPDEPAFAAWCVETSELLWGLSLEWKANQVPSVSAEIEEFRTRMWPFTVADYEPTRYVDGLGNPVVRDLVGLDQQASAVARAVEATFVQHEPAS